MKDHPPAEAPRPPDDEADIVDPVPVELEAEAAASAVAASRKMLIFAAVALACVGVLYLTPLKQYTTNPDSRLWKQSIQAAGMWAPLAFFGLTTVLIAVGVPRLVFCVIGGTLFGFVRGMILGEFASLAGSYATFVFVRWTGRAWAQRRIAGNNRLRDLLKHPSMFSVFLVRQIPIAGIIPNLILGMTHMRHRVFLIGSFLGYLPSVAMAALIGSGLGKHTLVHSIGQITLAMVALTGLTLLAWYLRRRLSAAAR